MCSAPKSNVTCPVNHINFVYIYQSQVVSINNHPNFAVTTVILLQHDTATSTFSLTLRISRHTIQNPHFNSANLETLPDIESSELIIGCRKESRINQFFFIVLLVLLLQLDHVELWLTSPKCLCESPTQIYFLFMLLDMVEIQTQICRL